MRQSLQRTSWISLISKRYNFQRNPLRWFTKEARQWSTPLARHLAEAIKTTGPISLASYMRQCLTSPDEGYYASAKESNDQFGRKGDFITSPEISQIFGELIAIWVVAEWIGQGKPDRRVELIEVGPGRGTLMDDMLRTIRSFKDLASVIKAVRLVETSPSLRDAQKRLLCGDASLEETPEGFKSTSKYFGVPIFWTENIRHIPRGTDTTPFIVAHEFFDALPVHAFQSAITTQSSTSDRSRSPGGPQWRELLVSPIESLPTAGGDAPEFYLHLSKGSTPHSLVLPEISHRYSVLKSHVGATIEISAEALSYAEEFARLIGGGNKEDDRKLVPSGAALIIDYGPSSTIPVNSLRGIRAHKIVSPFSSPGLVDLSADVDFTGLAEAALRASPAVEVHGPIEQGDFLQAMGIKERAKQLERGSNSMDAEKRRRLESSWKRLVERGGGSMGKIYKAMAIVPDREGKRRPVGFGGDIAA